MSSKNDLNYPLLAPFFRSDGGFVLYKGYPPQRGDDVGALLELASALPQDVQFAPIPPEWNTVVDLRHLLPELLYGFRNELAPNASTKLGDSGAVPDDQDSRLAGERAASEEILAPLIRQALVQMRASSVDSQPWMTMLRNRHRELFNAMVRMIATHPENLEKSRAGTDGSYKRDALRRRVQLPQDVPILIIGRPELLFGYELWSVGEEKSDLRRMLDSAGYPGRYYFADDRYADWLAEQFEKGPQIIRNPPPPPILDRKTLRVYGLRPEGRGHEDIGFIHASRTSSGQVVMVATGCTSLGTHAAVQLLLQNRHGFAAAMRDLDAPDTGGPAQASKPKRDGSMADTASPQHSKPIDIAFRCRRDLVGEGAPLQRARRAEDLVIELLNANELSGFTWGRRAHEIVSPLLAGQAEGKLQSGHMQWVWKRELDRVTRVTIHATPYRVSTKRTIYPSEVMGHLLERIQADVASDRQEWLHKIKESSKTQETFQPVLVLGATGTGKEWVAEMIAALWGGRTVEVEEAIRARRRATKGTPDPHEAAITQWLPERLRQWKTMAEEPDSKQFRGALYTVSVVETPETLLDSRLFGCLEGAATGLTHQLSAFIVAGTGVLFLDELLELDLSLQSRLLVALQTGRVLPLGSASHRSYFCRVVAATNRAETDVELRSLTTVRTDLAARFKRRYEVPRLAQRPLEIIPILMYTLFQRQSKTNRKPLRLRIKRPALELLLTHSYPENIRQLESFASRLPDDLIRSFADPRLSRSESLDACPAIDFQHLSALGVSEGQLNPELGSSRHFIERSDPLTELYEFEFPALLDSQEDAAVDSPATADLPKPLRALVTELIGEDDRIERMSVLARDLDHKQLYDLVEEDPEFRNDCLMLGRYLFRAHLALRDATGQGLNETRIRQVINSGLLREMPLQSMSPENIASWIQSNQPEDLILAASVAEQVHKEGRPLKPPAGAFVSLLAGKLAGF